MSLDLSIPKHIATHGWWTRNGEKMSKSKGNVIDPKAVADAYGLENFRYFLLREVPFGQDGDFSQKALIDRINNDLGNDLGNLLNRIIGMSGKYFDFTVDSKDVQKYHQKELEAVEAIIAKLDPLVEDMKWHKFLEELWQILTIANKAIDTHTPWAKMKEAKEDEAMALIALVANILAKAALMLHPVMPKTTQKIASALGFTIDRDSFTKLITQKELLASFTIQKIPPLFPKIEEPLMQEKKPSKENKEQQTQNLITIDEFFKTSIKVGTIIDAQEIPKSKKLLKLQVDLGEERPRQIIAGIKEYYLPEELLGKQVCVVANLKPAKLMGHLSEGMILAAKDDNGLSLISPLDPKAAGTPVK